MSAPAYVRLTFRPAGHRRRRTVWAIYSTNKGGIATFWRVNAEGEQPDPQELIVSTVKEIEVTPAVMSRKYATLMLYNDPELIKEFDENDVISMTKTLLTMLKK
jgi:hypothetical protein